MVSPMLLIALFLTSAFLIALFDKLHRKLSLSVVYISLASALGIGIWRLWQLVSVLDLAIDFSSAGFEAPLSIALRFGFNEAILISLINLLGLFGAVYLYKRFKEQGAATMVLYLLFMLGANGLILTRDVFNAFVFIEILSIAGYAILGVKQNVKSLSAGIKYMLAGGISSSIFLLGIVFAYRYTGTLNLDTWAAMGNIPGSAYPVALFLVAIGVFLELKPFPANGWALDLYQSADSGIGAIISTINAGAVLFLFYKLMPLFSHGMLSLFAAAGLVSFIFSNLVALRQSDPKRLLGYSSTSQAGLVVFVLCAMQILNAYNTEILLVAFGLFITNLFAKSGLFWLTGIVKEDNLKAWGVIRREPGLMVAMGVFLIALSGLPPFPAFFAKWQLVNLMVSTQQWLWLSGLLLGSLLELAYLLRWFGYAVKGDQQTSFSVSYSRMIPVVGAASVLVGLGYAVTSFYPGLKAYSLYPVLALLSFALIEFLPGKIKGLLSIGLLSVWAWFILVPNLPPLGQVFVLVLVGGSIVQIFGFMRYSGRAEGLFPLLSMLVFSLGNLLIAGTKLEFFIAWELMALSSYLLIMRGKKAQAPALIYILFSTVGAFLLITALALMPELKSQVPLIFQLNGMVIGELAALLAALAFLIKMGALGVHYWLPGAYAEAEDETSSILSSVLSKAGVYGLLIVLIMMRGYVSGSSISMISLGWLGAATALIGALMAVFQEDVKKLLAYSSMSQLGYVIMGLSLMSHLGWVSAMYLTVNHLFFKALIFMAIAAVVMRTGTRNMYEMGGLIKKMPIAYMSVLLGIIAVSGVPPLSGFGSKWFIYTSLLEQGRYLQAGMAFFSSAVAFLYLYRLIQTVFLGQLKPQHKDIKEAPIWLIIPQGVFMMAIMAISVFPNLITKTLSGAVGEFIAKPEWLSWEGYNVVLNSPILKGNWNGNLVMLVTMGVFMTPLIWLILVNAKAQKVKQFNIVFAAERPYKPSTTHFAYNMFAPYNKALGFWVKPRATAFYQGVAEWTHSLSATISRIYTGNGQTYMLHIFLYIISLYLLLGVR